MKQATLFLLVAYLSAVQLFWHLGHSLVPVSVGGCLVAAMSRIIKRSAPARAG